MNFRFFKGNDARDPSALQLQKLARWEKDRAEGKWFWIFKRTASWLVSILLMVAAGHFLGFEMNLFQTGELMIVGGMMGGFVVSSLFDWSKMEQQYQNRRSSEF